MKIFAIYDNKTKKEVKELGNGWTFTVEREKSKESGEDFVTRFKFAHKLEGGGSYNNDFEVLYVLDGFQSVRRLKAINREGEGYYLFARRLIPGRINYTNIWTANPHLDSGKCGEREIDEAVREMSKYSAKYVGDDISKYGEFKDMIQVVKDQHEKVMSIEASPDESDMLKAGDILAMGADRDELMLIEVTKPVRVGRKSKLSVTGLVLAISDVVDVDFSKEEYDEWVEGKARIEHTFEFIKPDETGGDRLYVMEDAGKWASGKTGVKRDEFNRGDFDELTEDRAIWISER